MLTHRKSNIISVFRDFDKDQSGAMDSDELAYILRTLIPGIRPAEMTAIFSKMDENGDGNITYDEVCEVISLKQ